MKFNRLQVFGFLISLLFLAGSTVAYARTEPSDNNSNTRLFPRPDATKSLDVYSKTGYSAGPRSVRTLRGDALLDGKDTVVSFRVNPAGVNYGVVLRNKKGYSNAGIYSSYIKKKQLKKFDEKKYGQPTAITFTPDARNAIIAAGNGIYLLDTRKFIPYDKIQNVPLKPTKMVVSPNGYYLAVMNGDKVIVYNLEERSVRKTFDAGENVNDILFSPDSNDFGILTADGILTLYNTRSFELRKMIDNLGDALAADYNLDGKYVAVVTGPGNVAVINLLRDSDREYHPWEEGDVTDVRFLSDSHDNTIMLFSSGNNLVTERMPHLKPFYNKLIGEEVDKKMEEWLKMMPGETMDEYRARVTDESRARQRHLFEDEISTDFAGNLLAGASMSVGSYDRANGVLAINFDTMPTIYLPVPEEEVTSFMGNEGQLSFSGVMYGILPDDSFEIVYARVTNNVDGKTYVYDNLMRSDLDYLNADDAISLELLQQQQMEELKLQELREKVVNEARSMNIISDHTRIAVDSRVIPDYDANGNKILNYQVGVTYTVDPEFSVIEDFGPGKFKVEESGAASSMLNIVKEAFEGDFKQYLGPGKKMKVRILGTADATPIVHGIAYDGSYGEFDEEPVYIDGTLQTVSVNKKDGIKQNEQLAFLRALGVEDYLNKKVAGVKDMKTDYRYEVNVSKDKGSEYRRITLEITFIDAY